MFPSEFGALRKLTNMARFARVVVTGVAHHITQRAMRAATATARGELPLIPAS
jgi:hypothetical protein